MISGPGRKIILNSPNLDQCYQDHLFPNPLAKSLAAAVVVAAAAAAAAAVESFAVAVVVEVDIVVAD